MDPRLAVRVIGVVVMTFVLWHFWALYGLIFGLGMAMTFLP